MDFFKANDVLKGLRVSAAPTEAEKVALRRDKLEACKIVVDHLFTPQVMTMRDYPRLLCAVLDSLYCAHGDSDTNVWMVADESITRLIRLSTPTYSEYICYELMQILARRSSFVPSVRSVKSAFKKFADICGYLKPARARKYVDALITFLQDFTNSTDESLLEVAAGSIGAIFRSFAFYFSPKQADTIENVFLPLLGHLQPVIRRAAAICVTTLAEYSPACRHTILFGSMMKNVRALEESLKKEATASSSSSEAGAKAAADTADSHNEEGREKQIALRHGTLLACLQLVRMRRTFDDDEDKHSLSKIAPELLRFCRQSLKEYATDLTVFGAALEVISQMLQEDCNCPSLWSQDTLEVWHELGVEFVNIVKDESSRISNKAVAVGCLGLLYKHLPETCFQLLFRGEDHEKFSSQILGFFQHSDPLLRGQFCFLFGEVISMHLNLKEEALLREVCDVPAVIDAMIATFRGRSSVSAKMSCVALSTCVDPLLVADDPMLRKCALSIVASFLGTSSDAYWLVKLEVANALAHMDYHALASLENTLQDTPHLCGNTQRQAVSFIVDMLSSSDARIRRGASSALVAVAEKLWLPNNLDSLPPLTYSSLSNSGDLWPANPATHCHRGIAYIMKLLIERTLLLHPVSNLKGVNHAILAMTQAYGYLASDTMLRPHKISNTAIPYGVQEGNPNPLCSYAPDILPLLIERLCGSPFALDLESHIDMLAVAANLGREGRNYFDVFAPSLLRHCLKMLNIICFVMENRTPPPAPKDARVGHAYFTPSKATASFVGTFGQNQNYIDLFFRVHAAFTASLANSTNSNAGNAGNSSANSGGDGQAAVNDKFSEIRSVVVLTLAVVVQTVGIGITAHTEELMFYLLKLFPYDPVSVLTCSQELFKALYVTPQPLSTSYPYDSEGIFAAWNFSRYEYCGSHVLASNSKTLGLLRFFQPLVRLSMELYIGTTDGTIKASVLSLLTEMLKGGISYDHLDKDGNFLKIVLQQLGDVLPASGAQRTSLSPKNPTNRPTSPSVPVPASFPPANANVPADERSSGAPQSPAQQPVNDGVGMTDITVSSAKGKDSSAPASSTPFLSYFSHCVTTLPAIVEFLHVLFVIRNWSEPGLLDAEVLLRLARLPLFNNISCCVSWSALFGALARSIPSLFTEAAKLPHIEQYRNMLFNQIISRFPHIKAFKLATIFIYHARIHNVSWEMYSRAASIAGLSHIKSPALQDFKDFWRLCSFCSVMHPSSFIHNAWGEMILSGSNHSSSNKAEEVATISNTDSSASLGRINFSRLDRVLESLGLPWLPCFVFAARQANNADYDTLISAIHFQVRKPDYKDGKEESNEEEANEFDGGRSSHYEDIAFDAVISAVTKTCAQSYHNIFLSGVSRAVCLLVRSATSLLRRIAPYNSHTQPSVSAALSALSDPSHPFRKLLEKNTTPFLVAESICRFIRVLCTLASSQRESFAFFNTMLEESLGKTIPSIETVNQEIVRPSMGTVLLLQELCHYLALVKEPVRLEPAIVAAVLRNQNVLFSGSSLQPIPAQHSAQEGDQPLPSFAPFLREVLCDKMQEKCVLDAAELCLLPCVTQRGISNYVAILSNMPPSFGMLEVVASHLNQCDAPSLKSSLEMVFTRALNTLQRGTTPLDASQLNSLLDKINTEAKHLSIYTEARKLLRNYLSMTPPVIPAPTPITDLDKNVKDNSLSGLATVSPTSIIKYVTNKVQLSPLSDSIRFVPLMYSLGPQHFQSLLETGSFDWVLPDYLNATPMNELFASSLCDASKEDAARMICAYLRQRVRAFVAANTPKKEMNSLCTRDWQNLVFLAQSLSAALLKHNALMVSDGLAIADLVELGALLVEQFLVQWGNNACSPFDLVPIFKFLTLSLFDLEVAPSYSADSPPPCIVHLIPPLFKAFHITVLSQNLQASALIEAAVSKATEKERLRTMLNGLIAGVLVGDLSWDCHFGKSFADSVLTLLLTFARCFPALLFPTLQNDPDPLAMFDLPLFTLCQQQESPELALRLSLFFLTTVGLQSSRHFMEVHGSLRAVLTAPEPSMLGISEELQCLSLRALTSMILKACLGDDTESRLKTVLASPSYSYQREYGVKRAKTVNGLLPLQEVIFSALERLKREEMPVVYVDINQEDASSPSEPSEEVKSKQAPIDLARARNDGTIPVALWAFSDVSREDNPSKYSFEQVSVNVLRQKSRNLIWKGLNIGVTLSELFSIMENILNIPEEPQPTSAGGNGSTTDGSPSGDGTKEDVSALTSSLLSLTQLQAEAVYAMVMLSDLFTKDQFEWMYRTFKRMFNAMSADSTDSVLMSNLVFGLLKSAAVLDVAAVPVGASPEVAARATAEERFLQDVVRYSFEVHHVTTKSTSLIVAGVVGVTYLITSKTNRVLTPNFVLTIARFLLTELSNTTINAMSERTLLHLMSCSFALVTAFPKDCESNNFTRALLSSLMNRVNQRDCSIVTAQAAYKGMSALLTSQSLTPELRSELEAFALRKLQHPTHAFNSVKSFFALGLLLSSMYSGPSTVFSDTKSSQMNGTDSPAVPSAESAAAEMSQLERIQTLFTNLRRGMFSQHTPALIEIMALLVVDTFKPDQALSFILGEFAKHRSNHKVVAFIMNRVFELMQDKQLLVTWVSICSSSFLQRKTKALWSLTCALLACSSSPLLHGLFPLIASNAKEDVDLFVLACSEFLCDPNVPEQSCKDLLAAINNHSSSASSSSSSTSSSVEVGADLAIITQACDKIVALVPQLKEIRASRLH